MKNANGFVILISLFWGGQMLDAQLVMSSHPPAATPQPQARVERTATEILIHHPGGATTRHPREDVIRSSVKTVWKQLDDGNYNYEFDVDTRDAYFITSGWPAWDLRGTSEEAMARAVRESDIFLRFKRITPPGWNDLGHSSWSEDMARFIAEKSERKDDPATVQLRAHPWPTHEEHARFSFVDYKLPGVIPIYVQGYPDRARTERPRSRTRMIAGKPEMGHLDTKAIHRETSVLKNSRKHLVIGPGIDPDITLGELRQLTWLYAQEGISLVADLPKAENLAAAIDQLQPSTDFEREVVDCLRTAAARATR